jgi:serine/threonine protein kinase
MLTTQLLRPGIEPYPGCRLRQLVERTEYAEVWKATTVEERPIAVKFIVCHDDQTIQHDLPSLLAVRQLTHPHLIPIYWIWRFRDYVVVAMELARGSLLDCLMDSITKLGKPLAGHLVCRYLAQAANALDFLNASKHRIYDQEIPLQHGNIKPSNLLLVGDKVKLTDVMLTTQRSFDQAQERLAETLRYAAPEVFHGFVSDRTDQYALAVTYCHLRGGGLPFLDTPLGLDAEYVRPEPDLTMLPPAERPIIARSLSPSPEDRWLSCGKLMAHLTNLVSVEP